MQGNLAQSFSGKAQFNTLAILREPCVLRGNKESVQMAFHGRPSHSFFT